MCIRGIVRRPDKDFVEAEGWPHLEGIEKTFVLASRLMFEAAHSGRHERLQPRVHLARHSVRPVALGSGRQVL